ncbi:MAG: hypothetical protein EBY81_00590 [Verrucomicrobia bacterium]|nr:hypothetical protein [Verrucomicrobiota bacterium]
MSESSSSLSQRRHPYLPGLWLAIGFLALASITFMLRPFGVTPSTVTESAAKIRIEKLKKAQEEQQKLITTFGWIEKDKGVAHIPIEKAMQLTLGTLRQNPPHPAYAITNIQPSAISAAGAPLYPELPIAEVPKVVATSPTNAQAKSTGAQLSTNSLPKASPTPTLSVPPSKKKP